LCNCVIRVNKTTGGENGLKRIFETIFDAYTFFRRFLLSFFKRGRLKNGKRARGSARWRRRPVPEYSINENRYAFRYSSGRTPAPCTVDSPRKRDGTFSRTVPIRRLTASGARTVRISAPIRRTNGFRRFFIKFGTAYGYTTYVTHKHGPPGVCE